MSNEKTLYYDVKRENRNKIYNTIRERKSVSRQDLVHELKLSLPTVTQNLADFIEEGLIEEIGSIGHTGGRRAKAYGLIARSRVSIGIDVTRNHITVVVMDLFGEAIYRKRIRFSFSKDDIYLKKLGEMVETAVRELQLEETQILGVGIVVPGLITEDGQRIFYGTILNFTGMTCDEFGKYIPYPCRLFNDADAAGYAEATVNQGIEDSFYICLSNNVGGSILIKRQVYKGEGPRSGEVGHITLIPDGRECYCGQRGCFETYCNATILSEYTDGDLEAFFEKLKKGDRQCQELWKTYLYYLVIAVNNVRMLFDCKVILGGYVGAYLEDYIDIIREAVAARSPFEDDANYLLPCTVKRDALAMGGALPFVMDFIGNI